MEAGHGGPRTPSQSRSGSVSTALSDASEVAVSGRNKGIQAIDLDQVFSTDDARVLSLITCFDLSHNEMEVVASLEKMTALRKLNVSYNRIGRVAGLPLAITQLNLSHNRLAQLEGLSHLPHLRELDVSFNRLTSLIGLTTRTPLEVLHADDNRLVSSAGLEDMQQLRVLTLSNNFISSADELVFLSSTPALQILTLQNNPVARQTGYRDAVGRLQAAVLSLDGAPLLRTQELAARPDSPQLAQRHPWSQKAAAITTPVREKSSASTSPSRAGAPRGHRDTAMATTPRVGEPFAHAASASPHGPRRPTAAPAAVTTTTTAHSPSAHLVVTPSAAKSRPPWDQADISVESEAPEANGDVPQPTEPSDDGRSDAARASSTTPASSTFTPSGRGSYARQFVAAQKQQQQQQQQQRSPGLRVQAPWTQPMETESVGPPPSLRQPSASGVVRGAEHAIAKAEPASHASSVLVRPSEVQAEDAHLAQLHDSLVARDLMARENEQLRATVKRLEAQLADSRRVVSDQLAELSRTRLERDALRQSEEEHRARCERTKRSMKMQEAHHRDEVLTLQTQYERVKTFYETELADLRRQLAAELHRSKPAQTIATVQAQAPPPQQQQQQQQQALAPPPPLPSPPGQSQIMAYRDVQEEKRSLTSSSQTIENTPHDLAAWDMTVGTTASEEEHRAALPVAASSQPRTVRFEGLGAAETSRGVSRPAPLRGFSLLAPRTGRRGSSQDGTSPVSNTLPAATVAPDLLASQLKGWLYTEMAVDAGKAQEEALLAQLRASVEAEEEDRPHRTIAAPTTTEAAVRLSVSPSQASQARAMLEAFVTRQLAASPTNARAPDAVRDADSEHAAAATTAAPPQPHQPSLEVVEVDPPQRTRPSSATVIAPSPDAQHNSPPSPLPTTSAKPAQPAEDTEHGTHSPPTPSPPPLPATATVDHDSAVRDAERLLGAAASRLCLGAGAAVQQQQQRQEEL